MVEITIQVPEALAERIASIRERLPEVLAIGLKELPPLPNEIYRYVLEFLESNPSPQLILEFKPTPTMQEHISELLEKNRTGKLRPEEAAELDEYVRIDRFLTTLKIRALRDLENV